MSHTPIILEVDNLLGQSIVLGNSERGIALIPNDGRGDQEWINNARRIAALWNIAERLGLSTEEIESGNVETKLKAAPDMLEALETIMDIGDKACRDIARAAIQKARGEE